MDRSDLAERMKGYEKRNRYYLQRRMPVILRLDMRAGHSFTRGFERPFDEVFIKSMQDTAKYLCENIQNCKLSYQQSDEITLLLVDYDKLNTEIVSLIIELISYVALRRVWLRWHLIKLL